MSRLLAPTSDDSGARWSVEPRSPRTTSSFDASRCPELHNPLTRARDYALYACNCFSCARMLQKHRYRLPFACRKSLEMHLEGSEFLEFLCPGDEQLRLQNELYASQCRQCLGPPGDRRRARVRQQWVQWKSPVATVWRLERKHRKDELRENASRGCDDLSTPAYSSKKGQRQRTNRLRHRARKRRRCRERELSCTVELFREMAHGTELEMPGRYREDASDGAAKAGTADAALVASEFTEPSGGAEVRRVGRGDVCGGAPSATNPQSSSQVLLNVEKKESEEVARGVSEELQKLMHQWRYDAGSCGGVGLLGRRWLEQGPKFTAREPLRQKLWPLDVPMRLGRVNVAGLLKQAEGTPEEVPLRCLLGGRETVVQEGKPKFHKSFGLEGYVNILVEAGIWKRIPRRMVRTYVSAFTIPKVKKETRRLICNAIPLNDKSQRTGYDLSLPGLSELVGAVRTSAWFVELDGVSYFNQFPVPPDLEHDFVVRVGSHNYAWCTMPMGWLNAVDVAQAASLTVQRAVKNSGPTLTFVDNLLRFGDDQDSLRREAEGVIEKAWSLNLTFEVTTQPTQAGKALGVWLDLKAKEICLAEEFRAGLQPIRDVLGKRSSPLMITYRQYYRILGNFIWGLRVLHKPLYLMQRSFRLVRCALGNLLSKNLFWDEAFTLPDEVREELSQIAHILLANKPYSVPEAIRVVTELYTDASESGWGVVSAAKGITLAKGRFPFFLREQPIALKELWAVLEGVKSAPKKHGIHVFCDNTNVVSWVRKRLAGPPLACSLLRRLDVLLEGRQLEITWISTKENLADAPSRDFQ
eukprot:PhM_4_TR8398/c2_g2_i1/m.62673